MRASAFRLRDSNSRQGRSGLAACQAGGIVCRFGSRTPRNLSTVNREPSRPGCRRDLAADRLDQVLDDREAQPGAPEFPAPRLVDPVEPLEDARQVVTGDADPGVGDLDGDDVRPCAGRRRGPLPPRVCT